MKLVIRLFQSRWQEPYSMILKYKSKKNYRNRKCENVQYEFDSVVLNRKQNLHDSVVNINIEKTKYT